MRFVRAFWRFLVGVKDALALLLLLILFGALYVALSSGGPGAIPSGGALVRCMLAWSGLSGHEFERMRAFFCGPRPQQNGRQSLRQKES